MNIVEAIRLKLYFAKNLWDAMEVLEDIGKL